MYMKKAKKILTTSLSAITVISIPTVSSLGYSRTIRLAKEYEANNPNKTMFTFYIGKNSGLPFGGSQVIEWDIKDSTGKIVATIDDIGDDGFIDGKVTKLLDNGSYTAEIKTPLSNPNHYKLPKQVVEFDSSKPIVDLTYTPQLWDGPVAPEKQWELNDVIYNYKFNDINDNGFSLERNKSTEKLTILFFFRTTCPYSRRTLQNLTNALRENNWENKVNVLALSCEDSEQDLKDFSKRSEYSSSIRYVKIPNNSLKYQFVPHSGYPAMAYIDYQGTFVAKTDEERKKGEISSFIRKFSKKEVLEKDVTSIPKDNLEHIDPSIPEIDINGHVIENNEPYLELPKENTLPDTLDVLKKTKPEAIATVSKYDSRDYGIVTPVKDQGKEGLCWTYATAAASETAILREGLSPLDKSPDSLVDLSEHNIDLTTRNRTPEFDLLKLNPEDKWTGQKGTGNVVVNATDSLAMWNSPIDSNNKGDTYDYKPADYFLEDTIRLGNTEFMIREEGLPSTIKQVKELIARYGAVTASYSCNGTNPYTNTNSRPQNGGHAVTIVGWDDSIESSKYSPKAQTNGGWICKNSWGKNWVDSPTHDGYFYMSYDSEIDDMTAFDYSIAHDKYDNNYYYDAKTTNPGQPNGAINKQAAAIYQSKKANFETKEVLKAVNVGFLGKDTTVTAKIYKGVNADFDHPLSSANQPTSGQLVATVSKHFKYGGYKTLDLYEPIELEQDETFSIVVELTNGAELFYGSDKSNDNMTFFKDDNGNWTNPMKTVSGSAARIKAFTKQEKIENANSSNLKDAIVDLSTQSYRFGDDIKPQVQSVSIGKKQLSLDDYDIIYNQPEYNLPQGGTSTDNEVIGKGSITIKGKGKYEGTKTLKYNILVGLTPDFQGRGWYSKNNYGSLNTLNIRVKNSATTYNDIQLPNGFKWSGNPNQRINYSNPLPIDYINDDKKYYRYNSWSGYRLVLHPMSSDDFELIPPEFNPNIPHDETNNSDPTFTDPDYNLANLEMKLERDEYTYTGQAITPKVKIKRADGYELNQSWNSIIVEYKNNKRPGIAKVIVKSDVEQSVYYGQKELEFRILDENGNLPTVDPNAPVDNEFLETIDLSLNKSAYNFNDTIIATANVNPNNVGNLKYVWEIIDGEYKKILNINAPQISLNANTSFANKKLQVSVYYKDDLLRTSKMLVINSSATPDAPDPNKPIVPENRPTYPETELPVLPPSNNGGESHVTPPSHNNGSSLNNGINSNNQIDVTNKSSDAMEWWVFAIAGVGALLLIGVISWLVISLKSKKNKKQVKSNNQYTRPVNTEVKTIPTKSGPTFRDPGISNQ